MNITPDHWLEGVTRLPLPGGAAMPVRRFLVMHFTSGASARSSVDFWRSPAAKGACAHVIIDRDGTVYQCRPFNRTAGHAGKSTWRDPNTGTRYDGLNACSIGIEFANAGDDDDLARRWSRMLLLKARHKNGGPECEWERFTAEQIAASKAVAKALVERYRLDDLIGHDDIAPDRKNDPGPAFPMREMREACGFQGLPKA
jgi:N-acetylmuramoyl-L-alanine amidase